MPFIPAHSVSIGERQILSLYIHILAIKQSTVWTWIHSAIAQEDPKSQHQRMLLFLITEDHNSFLPTKQLLSGSQMKAFLWLFIQIFLLETSFILIKTCCILKCFVQRKDLKMYPRKFMSCLPYERIKDHNLSRVWQLYSLEHMQSHATLTNIHVFCLQDATICYATNVHTQRTIWRLALPGESRHIFFPFEISPRWMIPFFLTPLLAVLLYLFLVTFPGSTVAAGSSILPQLCLDKAKSKKISVLVKC